MDAIKRLRAWVHSTRREISGTDDFRLCRGSAELRSSDLTALCDEVERLTALTECHHQGTEIQPRKE
jgi:hypothetical protein